MIQTILIWVAATIVGWVIGHFLIKIFNKLRVFLFRKSDTGREEIENFHIKGFYNTFGFYYEDVIKYAPELDEFISSQIDPHLRDRVTFKMVKMREIYDAIRTIEQIDILKFKQLLENIKTQKTLENIDG